MKDLKLYILLATLGVGAFLFYQYGRPAPVSWTKTYVKDHKIPYGTVILYEQLPNLLQATVNAARQPVFNTLVGLDTVADQAFIVVAPSIQMDEMDYSALVNFVAQGNDAFLASYNHGELLKDSLGVRVNSSFIGDSAFSSVRFTNPLLAPNKQHLYDNRIGADYFAAFDSTRAEVLAENGQGAAVYIRYRLGAGNLYLFSSPDYFINYALLRPEGEALAAKAFSYLDAKRIIWDDFQTQGKLEQTSIMRVFLENAGLRQAYFLSLIALLLFVLYNIKRRQRVIPIADPLHNTSIQFAKVISSVYYHRRNNNDIFLKKISYFLEHIRITYRMKTNTLDTQFVEQLSAKSGVNTALLHSIIKAMHNAEAEQKLSDDTLITYNEYLETFYKQTIWKQNTLAPGQT